MTPPSYGEVLALNVRAARSRKRLGQASVVARMRALGYDQWHRQTMGKVERGERRLMVEEILGLALALETSIGMLLDPTRDDQLVTLPAGQHMQVMTVLRSVRHFNDGMVYWEGDEPRFDRDEPNLDNADLGSFDMAVTPEMMRRRNARLEPPPTSTPQPPRKNREG